MKNTVLDACAILAYLRNEPGADVVAQLLTDPNAMCFVHSINLCEVYYQAVRMSGFVVAKQIIADLRTLKLIESDVMDEPFWMRVGDLKARGGIALPDCFALTLAAQLNAQIVTSDHKEFDPIVPLGICPILFIR